MTAQQKINRARAMLASSRHDLQYSEIHHNANRVETAIYLIDEVRRELDSVIEIMSKMDNRKTLVEKEKQIERKV